MIEREKNLLQEIKKYEKQINSDKEDYVALGNDLEQLKQTYEECDNSYFKEYNVITLCGSTKFKEEFLQVQKELTLQGNIVISVGFFEHSGDEEVLKEGTKEMFDDMHKRKIDMANEIFVINKGGYIGSSTKSEIEYAKSIGKRIKYLEE